MLLTKPHDAIASTTRRDMRSPHTIFWQALVTNVLNPKVILFFLAFIPQFVRPDAPNKALAFLVLGVVIAGISMCWNSGTAILAGAIARRAGRNPQAKRWLERLVGATFIALGVKLAFTRT